MDGPPKGAEGDNLQDQPSGALNHEKQMVNEMMGQLDNLYAETNSLNDIDRTTVLYQLISRCMMSAFGSIPIQDDVWAMQADAGMDTMDHFIKKRKLCTLFLSSLEDKRTDGQKKRLYTAALNQYLEYIKAGIESLNQRHARVDPESKRQKGSRSGNQSAGPAPDPDALDPEPKRQKGSRPGNQSAGPAPDPGALVSGGRPVLSIATLQTIDRMISIICAREH